MGLIDKLKGVNKYTKTVTSKGDFKKLYLDSIIQSDELKSYFFDGDKRKDDYESKYHYSELVRMVDNAYDNYGKKNYEDKGFLRKFIAKPLRKVGAGIASIGHYLLNVYYSPEACAAYAVTMLPAVKMMVLADLIEGASYLYHNHSGRSIRKRACYNSWDCYTRNRSHFRKHEIRQSSS